ncbi:MAG: hypothetical protein LBR54_03865 [Oscillospiraceae bacterium]|jgi:hypothetical protein|nr:hypothetical protein [Oscillospiraceae bacterium]
MFKTIKQKFMGFISGMLVITMLFPTVVSLPVFADVPSGDLSSTVAAIMDHEQELLTE